MARARIQFKTDKTANWSDSFTPLAGELCIFSDYEETEKTNHLGNKIYRQNIKIGTGNKSLNDISFLGNEYISSEQIDSLFGSLSSKLGNFKLGHSVLISTNKATSSKLEEGQLNYMVLA